MGQPVTGAFTAPGQSAWFTPRVSDRDTNSGDFNVFLSNTGTATLHLEATPDGGATVFPIFAGGTQLYTWNYAGSPIFETADSCEPGVWFRLNATAVTGEVDYRISGQI